MNAEKLHLLIEQTHGKQAQTYKNMYAMGCWLHLTGHERAGRKLVKEVILSLPAAGNKMYFAELHEGMAGHEIDWAAQIQASQEINELFETAVPS